MKNVLFVCSQNRLPSPTAEQTFAFYPGINVASAGTNNDADNPLTAELLQWADPYLRHGEIAPEQTSKAFQSGS
jgi:predicted protein tyrosine phosphatase